MLEKEFLLVFGALLPYEAFPISALSLHNLTLLLLCYSVMMILHVLCVSQCVKNLV